jgi:hypothetical protein
MYETLGLPLYTSYYQFINSWSVGNVSVCTPWFILILKFCLFCFVLFFFLIVVQTLQKRKKVVNAFV